MNATKWTSGPWSVGFSDGTGETYITAGDHPARAVEGVAIIVGGCEDSFGIKQGVRDPANANLIAAAPELYAALEAMVAWYGLRSKGSADELMPASEQLLHVREAMAALSRARGEP